MWFFSYLKHFSVVWRKKSLTNKSFDFIGIEKEYDEKKSIDDLMQGAESDSTADFYLGHSV